MILIALLVATTSSELKSYPELLTYFEGIKLDISKLSSPMSHRNMFMKALSPVLFKSWVWFFMVLYSLNLQ